MTTSWDRARGGATGATLVVAIVAYQGVLADESQAFRDVLSMIPGARVLTAGAHLGSVAGPGGVQEVDATFNDVDQADVVVVPGGLGTHRHPEIAAWLRRIRPQFVLTSSTGSALLAASGLLRGHTAVTHWLAGPLLERHGVVVSTQRLVVDGPYVTCSGLATAFDAAFVVARHAGGPSLVREIRERLRDPGGVPPPPETHPRRAAAVSPPRSPTAGAPTGIVEVELEERNPHR